MTNPLEEIRKRHERIDAQDYLEMSTAEIANTLAFAHQDRATLLDMVDELEAEAKDGFDQLAVSQREVAELEALVESLQLSLSRIRAILTKYCQE